MNHHTILKFVNDFLCFVGVGPAAELEYFKIPVVANLKVGYNLKDHLAFQGLRFVYDNTHDHTFYEHSHDDLVRYLKDGAGPLTSNGIEMLAFLKTPKSKDKTKYPDIELIMKRDYYLPGMFFNQKNNTIYKYTKLYLSVVCVNSNYHVFFIRRELT